MSGIWPSINGDVRDEIMGRSMDLEGISDVVVKALAVHLHPYDLEPGVTGACQTE